MKFKHLLTATALMLSISVVAQPQAKNEEAKEEEGFKFTTIKELPITSVKDQNQAGTCPHGQARVRFLRNVHRLQDLPRPR